jgi:4-hydroxy-3-methylbut-2-enyl diphosphate reductase
MMQVLPITPRGYCPGVVKAIDIVNKAIENPTLPRPIYILGMIVHNRFVVDDFTQKGVITLNETGKTRLELLDYVKEGTVIITAHGTEDAVFQKIKDKGLTLINATCKDVQKTHDLIKGYLEKKYEILFIGKNHHPETEGALGIDPKIQLIESLEDVLKLSSSDHPIFVTNQTTLSIRDLDKIFALIQTKFPHAVISDEICNSTRIRQEAVLKSNNNIDLCFVVGDPFSHNTASLVKLSKTFTNAITYPIESVDDIRPEQLLGYKTVSVTSGASTPTLITSRVIEYLKQFDETDKSTWVK